MTTEIIHKDGTCGKQLRIKKWESGFSIKCLQGKRTLVGRPYYEDYYKQDLANFCNDCSEVKKS